MRSRVHYGVHPWTPTTSWFNQPVTSASGTTAGGTLDWASAADYGRVYAERDKTILYAHLHVELDATTSGTVTVEMYRNRGQTFNPGGPGTLLLIATASQVQGQGNGTATSFTFVDDAYKSLLAGDYLHMQLTSKMSGGNWRAFVDIHYDLVHI